MSRHLKEKEWIKIFKLYKKYVRFEINKNQFILRYKSISKRTVFNKNTISDIKNKLKKYNLGMNIESKSGESSKKGIKPRKSKDIDKEKINEERKAALKRITREQLEFFITDIFYEELLEKTNSKNLDEVIDKFKKKHTEMKNSDLMKITGLKKSTFYYKLNKFKNQKYNEKIRYQDEIIQAFYECKGRYGRVRLSFFLKEKYDLDINPRTLGRKMLKLNLVCQIRKKKKQKEIKNTNVKYDDLVKRDYDGKYNDIFATDVSYIPAPIDVSTNHIYLSATIHHKTKKIVSWNLSIYNDNLLVMNDIMQIDFPPNFILHSDHGYQYSSHEYVDYVKEKNGKISMSRIGNSLDNREIEYFFSILKSEIFPNFYQITKMLTFSEIKEKIKEFIKWYNNERFMQKFNLKTPQQMWEVYIKNN